MLVRHPYTLTIKERDLDVEITLSVSLSTGEYGLYCVEPADDNVWAAARAAVSADQLFGDIASELHGDRRELSSMGQMA